MVTKFSRSSDFVHLLTLCAHLASVGRGRLTFFRTFFKFTDLNLVLINAHQVHHKESLKSSVFIKDSMKTILLNELLAMNSD